MELESTMPGGKQEICVGIDLGTTNSCVAWYDNSQRHVIVCANEFGNRTTPSVVSFNENERLVGESALKQGLRNPVNTIYESKRFIGRSFPDCTKEQSQYPFQYINLGDGNVNFVVKYHGEDRVFCPEEIAALILQKMCTIAADHTGCEVTRAVITVPAYFNDAQRQATLDAGRIAGIEVLRIINEPTAAAIAYGMDRKASEKIEDVTVLVCDVGGGTTDISLMKITRDGIFEVLAIAGDTRLGGADFDQRLIRMVATRYEKRFGKTLDLTQSKMLRRVCQACEKAKCGLSGSQQIEIELDGIGPDGDDFLTVITRAQFNNECNDLYEKCMGLVRSTLADAKLKSEDVDEIVLVGGSTRIPRIQELLSTEFGGKELCKSISPDEAVAYGAAIQAHILNSADTDQPLDENCDLVLLDICPLSLGVNTTGGLMSVIIPRNSKVPIKKSRVYSTTDDNQADVTVTVYEGERSNTADNNLLGSFELGGIQLAARGTPKIRVSFEIDADGIFTVTAADESDILDTAILERPKQQTLTIQNNKGRLSEEEVARIVKDSEHREEQDAIFRQYVKTRTDYENLLYGVRRTFSENKTLHNTADETVIQCVLDIVSNEFEWLENPDGGRATPSTAIVKEFERKRDWIENEVARPIVDEVNRKIRDAQPK